MASQIRMALLAGALSILVLASMAAQTSSPPRGRGEEWLSWSSDERRAVMGAYLQGYFMGKSDACETAAELFGPRKPIHDLDQDPERRCFRHAKRYTMSVADYVSIITSFYEKYPEHRDIPVDYFMIVFRDQRYKTLADIERGMRKGAFRTTF